MFNRLIFILFIVLTQFGCDEKTSVKSKKFVAYSWNPTQKDLTNISPFYWLKTENINSFDQFVIEAVQATNAMPDGLRALFSWNLHREMAYQRNGDFLFDGYGNIAGCQTVNGFKPYRSLWWDRGVELVKKRFERFFDEYSKAGGLLDVFVLDFEQGFSYWHLKQLTREMKECDVTDYLDAIQNDPRYKQWQSQFDFSDLKSIDKWYENEDHLKWQAVTWMHLAQYIDVAIYQPMKKYFPKADFSNYGYYYQNTELNFPDIHGNYRHRYTRGVHVGTHQSRDIYGWVDLPSQIRLGRNPYPTTAFNAFRFAVNKTRAMLISSNVPVSPWIAYKGFENSYLKDNDFYQELIFHMMMSGIDYLLYWNPSHLADYSPENDELLNNLLTQVNEVIGSKNVQFNTTKIANWLDDILITKVWDKNNQQIWRLTVNIDNEKNIADFVINENPVKINIAGNIFNFEDMKILKTRNTYSNKGLWLISR